MCGGSEQLNSKTPAPSSSQESESLTIAMNNPIEGVETKYSFSALLELAADNNVEDLKRSICDASAIGEVGLWYGHQRFSKKMVIEQMTPLMIAAKYGSIDVVKLILSLSEADVNLCCGLDKSTALHCAASGGSVNAIEIVKLLLLAGADPNITDANGHRPVDVIVAPWHCPNLKVALEEILKCDVSICKTDHQVSPVSLASSLPVFGISVDNDSLSSASDSILSPVACKPNGTDVCTVPEKREYPIDPSLPDIKSSIYATDEFRMFSFKVRPCSRAYSHDWTECPFAHPGENARRRDPRKFHYSCVPCPDFRKGTCKRGDLCEYAHGVFECWLHPAQYRTRLCKDGTTCMRRVCFFAHAPEELRPLYVSTGSGLPSPRAATSSASAMDMATVLNMLPGSPSAVSAMSPSSFTPPLSPSGNCISHTSIGWPQQNIPALHLPGGNFQTSRLRSSLNARDIPAEELTVLHDYEMHQQQLLDELFCPGQPANLSACLKSLTPSNLDEFFSAEVSSPCFSDQLATSSVISPSHKSVLLNQLQQKQSMLSPIKTNLLSTKNAEHPLLQASFGLSPQKMSPRAVQPISPMSYRLSALSYHEKHQQELRRLDSRELGTNFACDLGFYNGGPVNAWSKWEYSNGKVDWSVQADELGRLRKSCPMLSHGQEPDFSWVQPLVKESPSKNKEVTTVATSTEAVPVEGSTPNLQSESSEHDILGAWIEQLQLDQIVA